MKLYADTPARRTGQIASDLWMVVWVVLWVWVGMTLHDLVMVLAKPGEELADAGDGLERGLTDAGEKVSGVPLIGGDVRVPFDEASGAGGSLRSAGEAQVAAVEDIATFLGVAIAVVAISIMLVLWLPRRVRFVRQASSAQRFIDGPADLDLFALRALARQPMARLAKIHEDPAGAWRAQDPDVIQALARLELKDTGLRAPAARPVR